MDELTPRQQQILDWIRDHLRRHQRPPTQAEITAAMGFRSRTATRDHLEALARKGALSLQRGASRGIVVHDTSVPTQTLPLVGRVAAGQPILALEHVIAEHQVDPSLFRARADYLLSVSGHSMRDAGILDGDLLAVQHTPEARNGDIVVARLDEEVTVKRFEQQQHQVRLLPANPDFSPIEIDLRRQPLVIEGRMVGLIRPTP
ncbi:LexA repressor [Oceanococcus atlanticus]|uniref:LexA repressor n=1 Tax=Oceanococcus atlanticus TaxID=1317117 RepID=A0A1Y1S9R1_9GAMM|nr:transcriptional repressor LexA [Oceanococcus atlanticus]ORE85010.1 LexA repressor [Oceanococcus atlanticus]